MTKKEYLELLERSFASVNERISLTGELSRLEYLSEYIFDYGTYCRELSELLARETIDVCGAVSNKKVFRQSDENYAGYIRTVNMSFFKDRLNWGMKSPCTWWAYSDDFIFESYGGLYDANDESIPEMTFSRDEWIEFISAMIEFGKWKGDE
jgi:hypothetical protein